MVALTTTETAATAPPRNTILTGDALTLLRTLPDNYVQCVVTSPPYYGLRSYSTDPVVWDAGEGCQHKWGAAARTPWANSLPGPDGRSKNVAATRERAKDGGPFCQRCGAWRGELGSEPTLALYLQHLVTIFREVRRVLRDDGTCWVNMGDSYAATRGYQVPDSKWSDVGNSAGMTTAATGLADKNLIGVPWRLAFALQDNGWLLRSDVVWCKSNPMPEPVADRPARSHEYVFLLAKSGGTTYWTHPTRPGTRRAPAPDYRYRDRLTGEETTEPPAEWRTALLPATPGQAPRTRYQRRNLWTGHDYCYDAVAVREPAIQEGRVRSDRVGGNQQHLYHSEQHLFVGGDKPDKQRGHSRRHAGFNDRWDHMTKDAQMAQGRNCQDVWVLATEPTPEAHWATFPTRLVTRPVLAGTAPRACEHCGAPWHRQADRTFTIQSDVTSAKAAKGRIKPLDASNGWQGVPRGSTAFTTTGWAPTCDCADNTGSGRCVVLDPFGGSGTTAAVAQALGRDWLLLELNPAYTKIARQRVARGLRPARRAHAVPAGQGGLWGAATDGTVDQDEDEMEVII